MKALKFFLVLVLIGLISFIVVLVVYGGPEQKDTDGTGEHTVGSHRIGNLFENINAGGEFACADGNIYYITGNKLVCSDASGSMIVLYEDPEEEYLDRENVNVLDGWIYWGNYYIHKIRTDGTDFQRINFNSRRIDKMYAVDDRLLINTGDALWTVNTSGTDKKQLVSGEIYDTCMANDRLYYRDDAKGYIRYILLDGTEKGTLYSAGRCSGLHLYGDRLYFVESGLRSMDLDGRNKQMLDPTYSDPMECGFNETVFMHTADGTLAVNLNTLETRRVPRMQNTQWIDGRYIAQNGAQTRWSWFDSETFDRTIFRGK